MSEDLCQVTVIHSERLALAREGMPGEGETVAQAGLYKLLGDPTRLRLLQALEVTEMCVCDLAALLDTTASAVSHQLRLLRHAGLVRFRRQGKIVYYRLGDGRLSALLGEGRRYVTEGGKPSPSAKRV